MPIVQQGSINTTALVVPDLYVQIVPPQVLNLNGVPTDIIGVVGTSTWGPVGQPVICSTMADYAQAFGPIVARKYDMGTQVATAVQQGAGNFRCVRATDATDLAASWSIPSNGPTLTAVYTGSLGNAIAVTLAAGSAKNSWKFTVALPGGAPEIYNNLTNGVTPTVATSGSGYTSIPGLTFPTPAGSGGVKARGSVNLTVTAIAIHAGAGGLSFVTGDTVSFGYGIVGTVTASGGVVSAVAINNSGSTSVAPASNPISQVSTSGSGTGLKVDLTWGIGSVTMLNSGSGYAGSEGNPVLNSGGFSVAGTVTAGYTIWPSLVSAINSGQTALRGPSQIVTAAIGSGSPTPAALSTTFATGTPGTDGVTNITAATLVGVDTIPRSGMYALRSQHCSIGVLADADDSTQWSTVDGFGQSEGIYMIQTGPVGDTIANAVTTKATAGIDSYSTKLMFGDWIYWYDQTNQVTRLVSPQGFVAGRLANLSPEQSSLNKQLYSVQGSQKLGTSASSTNTTYSAADLGVLFTAGIDVVTNPAPGGAYWAVRCGHNSSSNAAVNGDNYTRLTNYIASTLAAGMGLFVGMVVNSELFQQIRSTLLSFFQNMLQQHILGSTDGSIPFSVICDTSNNLPSRTSLGYVQADSQVNYQAINEKFIVNVEGGQTVQVVQTTTGGQPNQ